MPPALPEVVWTKWVTLAIGHLRDDEGPGPEPENRVRVWVKTGKQLTYENEFERSKTLEARGKAMKKPSDEDIDKVGKLDSSS